jgi:hypothetical protein
MSPRFWRWELNVVYLHIFVPTYPATTQMPIRFIALSLVFAVGVISLFRHMGATFPKYFTRTHGKHAPYELVLAINPMVSECLPAIVHSSNNALQLKVIEFYCIVILRVRSLQLVIPLTLMATPIQSAFQIRIFDSFFVRLHVSNMLFSTP